MNLYPLLAPISVGIGIVLGYFLMKYIDKKLGKHFTCIGELMYPMHNLDNKIDKRYRKGKR